MLVFPTTEQVEVFFNSRGDITIMQEDCLGDDPVSVCIPLIHVNSLIKALRQVKKEAESAK